MWWVNAPHSPRCRGDLQRRLCAPTVFAHTRINNLLFRSEEDFTAWLAANPTIATQTGAERKDVWIAAFPQLVAGSDAAFAELTDDPTWDERRVFPLAGLFAAPWFREQATAFSARLAEHQRRWENDQ